MESKFPTFEEIEKMIEDEFKNHPMVSEIKIIETPDPSVRGRYSTRLNIDEKLDDEKMLKEKIKQYVNEEVINAFIEATRKFY